MPSTVVVSQLPVENWHTALAAGDPTLADVDHDQAAAYAAAWQTFEGLQRVSPHRRDAAAWAAGRGPQLLLAASVGEPSILAAIARVQRQLSGLRGVQCQPLQVLHISVQWCGFLAPVGRLPGGAEICPAEVDALLRRLARGLADVPSFEIALAGVNAFHSAAILETHSGGRLLGLRQRVREVGGEALARVDPFPGFLFHLTIAYFEADASAPSIRYVIRPLRGLDLGCPRVERLDLFRVPAAEDSSSRPRALASFPLAARCHHP